MDYVKMLLFILAACAYAALFFAGYAAAFFGSSKVLDYAANNNSGAFVWCVGWGLYLGGMITYPAIVLGTTAYLLNIYFS